MEKINLCSRRDGSCCAFVDQEGNDYVIGNDAGDRVILTRKEVEHFVSTITAIFEKEKEEKKDSILQELRNISCSLNVEKCGTHYYIHDKTGYGGFDFGECKQILQIVKNFCLDMLIKVDDDGKAFIKLWVRK